MFTMKLWNVPGKHENIVRLADIDEVRKNVYNLSIFLYVYNGKNSNRQSWELTIEALKVGCIELKKQIRKFFIFMAKIGTKV